VKVLFVSGIYPPDIGGPATYVSRMALELLRRGHLVRVLTLGERRERLDSPFPVRKVLRGTHPASRCLRMSRAALNLAGSSDIIYATGSPWDSWLVSTLAAGVHRKPLVLKIVGDAVWERYQRKHMNNLSLEALNERSAPAGVEIQKLFRNRLSRFADCVITPSGYLKGIVAGWGVSTHRIQVIHNAVDPFQGVPLPHSERKKEIVTVARLVPWKGVEGLMDILHRLPREVRLVVIGDGPLLPRLRERAEKKGLGERIHFTGRLPREEVFRYLSRTALFVLNSRYEGFPHVILEAMSAGAAVVATDVGGNAEVVRNGENGYLVPLDDQETLVERVTRLLEDAALRQHFSNRAAEEVRGFNWKSMVTRTESVLLEVLEKKTTKRS